MIGARVDGTARGAVISGCGRYRYRLWRYWMPELRTMAFIMLNPSTANATTDDQTIRKCIGFAAAHGCGGIEIVNLFAWRATDPAVLREEWLHGLCVGPENDAHILNAASTALRSGGPVVAGWGANAKFHPRRVRSVLSLLRDENVPLHCYGVTVNGHPKHPCYLSYNTWLQPL